MRRQDTARKKAPNHPLLKLYEQLLKSYGPQGWWPLLELHGTPHGTNPTKTGSVEGYHPGDQSHPKTERQRFEICVGAILTQNTAWPNVERALRNLQDAGALDPEKILTLNETEFGALIRPAGYFNQKAKKLRIFAAFFVKLKNKTPSRDGLLALWGVGPETADSIRLYAYGEAEFVVDAYTRRILSEMKLLRPDTSYDEIKSFCTAQLPRDAATYQEFHALLVEHAKQARGGGKMETRRKRANKNDKKK